MTKRHDELFDAVLSGQPAPRGPAKLGARFLKRGNAIAERVSGEREEKVLHWVDPARCRMWAGHNRAYDLLTEETCRDLIDGIRAQGRQEFPAIVRRLTDNDRYDYEVICGARRHFAVSWLRANNFPDFRYLIEVRDLTDEEAFRLGDIENRDREDISDYERASDYRIALDRYYGGKQKAMAERLEVSEGWLSRHLELARLPSSIVLAFPSIRDLKEVHARQLKPLLKEPRLRAKVLNAADDLARVQNTARDGEGAFVDPAKVIAQLKAAGVAKKPKPKKTEYRGGDAGRVTHVAQGKTHRLEFASTTSPEDLRAALKAFMATLG
ncbi:MAG: ParB/RepB/Spo0J family partition protein [Shimia sp.]